jgi:hypothetical protein
MSFKNKRQSQIVGISQYAYFNKTLSREKKLSICSKLSKRLFCNSRPTIIDLQLTKCAIARLKKSFRLMCHGKAQNVLLYGTKTFRVMCHRTAQNVPQHGTKCATAQNVPQHGTKRLMCHGKPQKVP